MSESIGRVLIRCPETGVPVETVYRLRPSAFAALQGEHRFRCKRCGQIHAWSRDDAWLEQAGPKRA
jgi:hypothetical protein